MPATKIMLIRHAEQKPDGAAQGVSAAGEADPEELIVRGWQRSGALVHLFAPRDGKFVAPQLAQPKTIFASQVGKHSNSLRPQHTVLELATQLNLSLDLGFRKGERLILVTDKRSATRADFQAFARSKHAAELMFPSEIIAMEKLPLLGSGKPDLQTIQKFVNEQVAAKATAAE